jgi:phosphoribosylformylglycinamidine synthase
VVKSAHDCSDGGLAVAVAESCVSQQIARETPRLIGAQIDLSQSLAHSGNGEASAVARQDALLFGETQWRILITTRALDSVKVIERAKLLGVKATRIGTVGGDKLTIATGAHEFLVSEGTFRFVVALHRRCNEELTCTSTTFTTLQVLSRSRCRFKIWT